MPSSRSFAQEKGEVVGRYENIAQLSGKSLGSNFDQVSVESTGHSSCCMLTGILGANKWELVTAEPSEGEPV